MDNRLAQTCLTIERDKMKRIDVEGRTLTLKRQQDWVAQGVV